MKKGFHNNKKKNTAGFTLVELMVSIAVFSIVMLISTGILLIMIDVNAKGQALYTSYSNVAFALDNITRELRTGRNYACTSAQGDGDALFASESTSDCVNGSMVVFDKGWSNERLGYRLSNGRIEQRLGASSWLPITGDEVDVSSFSLTVLNTGAGDSAQPTLDVSITGNLYNGRHDPTAFDISTHIVQHILDR